MHRFCSCALHIYILYLCILYVFYNFFFYSHKIHWNVWEILVVGALQILEIDDEEVTLNIFHSRLLLNLYASWWVINLQYSHVSFSKRSKNSEKWFSIFSLNHLDLLLDIFRLSYTRIIFLMQSLHSITSILCVVFLIWSVCTFITHMNVLPDLCVCERTCETAQRSVSIKNCPTLQTLSERRNVIENTT